MPDPAQAANTETQPLNPSIPPGWDGWTMGPFLPGQGPQGPQSEEIAASPPTATGAGCYKYTALEFTYGPIREGACHPIGGSYVLPFYRENCVWDIVLMQPGVKNRYRLQKVSVVEVVVCQNTTNRKRLSTSAPTWVKISTDPAICTERVLQMITTDPPCSRGWNALWALPDKVRDAVNLHATPNGAEGSPVGFGPPPRTGPMIGADPELPFEEHENHPPHEHSPHEEEAEHETERLRRLHEEYYRRQLRWRDVNDPPCGQPRPQRPLWRVPVRSGG